jgi:hypothetical protein
MRVRRSDGASTSAGPRPPPPQILPSSTTQTASMTRQNKHLRHRQLQRRRPHAPRTASLSSD